MDSLSNGGYQVDLAVDGDDGLRRSRPNGYAVMTIDRMLPRLDGLIVLRRVREDGLCGTAGPKETVLRRGRVIRRR